MNLNAVDAEIAARGGAAAVVQRSRRRHEPEAPLVRKLDRVLAAELDCTEDRFDDELIEGILARGGLGAYFGDSNSGKTFAAIDMAAAVARSVEWLGRPTAGGLVVYLATESPGSVQTRLKAYQRHHGLLVHGFVIVQSPINLFDGQSDTTAVINLVGEVETELGGKVSLIIGDTLARLAVGANENSGEDMGVVVQNIDAIRAATGAAFVLVHHCGKDAARGMRGWSGLRAAIDTEIEVTVDEATGLRSAEVTKQRDLPGRGDRLGFRLLPVRLGVNRWGHERGSCVVVPADAAPKPVRSKRPSEIAGAIVEFLTARGTGCLRGALAKHFDQRYARQSVYREVSKMLDGGLLVEAGGVVALPGAPGVAP